MTIGLAFVAVGRRGGGGAGALRTSDAAFGGCTLAGRRIPLEAASPEDAEGALVVGFGGGGRICRVEVEETRVPPPAASADFGRRRGKGALAASAKRSTLASVHANFRIGHAMVRLENKMHSSWGTGDMRGQSYHRGTSVWFRWSMLMCS